jgi:hypothetical protein
VTPLAGWLQKNDTELWKNSLAITNTSDDTENIKQTKKGKLIAAQIAFSFAVQITAGADVKYILAGPLSSVAPDFTATTQQTGTLAFVLNGPDALLSSLAKSGGAGVKGAKVDKPPANLLAQPSPGPSMPKGSSGYPIVPFGIPLSPPQ